MVRTGARDEVEEGKTGFAHFFEHMMFRGTKKYPNYDGITESVGAARNAFTSNDMTVYYLVAASEYLEQIVDLESDRFMNLDYSVEGFRTEAGAILGEYQQGAYSAGSVLDRAVRETAFQEHTYRHQTIGLEADVRAMPEGYEYSREFFRRFYRPENVVVVIAGDFDWGEGESLLRRYYGGWQAGYEPPAIPVEPEQTAARHETVRYEGRTLPILSFNWKAPAWSATDRLAVATEVLGLVAFGRNSAINRRLVLEEQRLQNLSPGFGLERDPTVVSLTAMVTNPDDVEAVKGEILAAVARARDELVEPKLLADTKSALKYGFLMGLETAQDAAFSLIGPVINTGTVEAVDDYYRTLESLTPEDIRDAARRILVDEGLTQVTLLQAEMGT
jgi:zinc protease